MAKKKLRFTSFDFILLFLVVIICLSTVVRNINVKDFDSRNAYKSAVITVSAKGINRDNFQYFSESDTIYGSNRDEFAKIGKVASLRSAPAIVVSQSEGGYVFEPDFSKIDITLEIAAECLVDENGFCSIGGEYLSPSRIISADNGRIIFDCEVVSVNITD